MDILQMYSNRYWQTNFPQEHQVRATNGLENGRILFFPQLAFVLEEQEKKFLSPTYVNAKSKNISFNFHTDELRGAQATIEEQKQIKKMLERFSKRAKNLVQDLFPHYQAALIQARTSFRPVQINQRKTSYRKDDKRLHVDAFPSNPNQGFRILRVFSNINPNGEDRVWRVGESFEKVAERFLPDIRKPFPCSASLLKLFKVTKSYRTEYDHIMLHIHDRMKADEIYQQKAEQSQINFPPNSSWIVQTDQVSHAAMSGQHVLEQTFYLPVHAMLDENRSPLRILEKMKNRKLVGVSH